MVQALGRALPGDLLVLAQDGEQLQLLEMVAQQDFRRPVGRRTHAAVASNEAYSAGSVASTFASGRFG